VIENFPYGKAPFWLLMVSLLSTVLLLATRPPAASKPDIIFTTFTPVHAQAYRRLAPEFERTHGVRVSIQLVHLQGLTSRLQRAMRSRNTISAARPGLSSFMLGSLMTPGILLMPPIYELMVRLHLVDSYHGLILPGVVSAYGLAGRAQSVHRAVRERIRSVFGRDADRDRAAYNSVLRTAARVHQRAIERRSEGLSRKRLPEICTWPTPKKAG
jgi:hypothetical protein